MGIELTQVYGYLSNALIMKSKPIHLLIVDDHKLIRSALSRLIRTFPFPTILYEEANGQEALEIISASTIDVVLLDIQMPVLNGMETIKKINDLKDRPLVIVLTQFDDQSLITFMLQHGASGFL